MKQFVIKLILFLFIIAGLDYVTGTIMDKVYAGTEKGDYGRNNYICTGTTADCLIFGSSRAIHQYDPKLIGEALGMTCYNCGEDGMGIITMYGRYQMIRQRHIPKVVIYDVVSGFDLSPDDKSKYIGWLRYYADNNQIAELIDSIDHTERYKALARSYKYNSRFVDIINQRISRVSGTAADYDYSPLEGYITYRVDPPLVGENYEVDAFKLSLFERMIHQCQQDGTKFVFAISPWYQAVDDTEYQSLISLSEKYNIPLLNHYKDKDINFNPELFKDASHLNVAGVELFDARVCNELKTMI